MRPCYVAVQGTSVLVVTAPALVGLSALATLGSLGRTAALGVGVAFNLSGALPRGVAPTVRLWSCFAAPGVDAVLDAAVAGCEERVQRVRQRHAHTDVFRYVEVAEGGRDEYEDVLATRATGTGAGGDTAAVVQYVGGFLGYRFHGHGAMYLPEVEFMGEVVALPRTQPVLEGTFRHGTFVGECTVFHPTRGGRLARVFFDDDGMLQGIRLL
jgi:hypothetical protein